MTELIWIFVMVVEFWLIRRTDQVAKFQSAIIDECSKWDDVNFNLIYLGIENSSFEWCWARIASYNKMLFSIKPLKYKYWIPEKEIKKLLML